MSEAFEDIKVLKPTTLSGIKSLAKQLKRASDLTHSEALDAAARQAGHDNWADALKWWAS
jgi:hypothetical protein